MHMRLRPLILAACALSLARSALATGPDLVTTEITDVLYTGTANGVHGFAAGLSICNRGDTPAEWTEFGVRHPLQSWSLYRVADGRIDQIGISWCKHGFGAGTIAGPTANCGTCAESGIFEELAPGCYDVYNAESNTNRYRLGSRSQINAAAGTFIYPPLGWTQIGEPVNKMAQVPVADLATPNAVYIIETAITHPGDGAARNQLNNYSHRTLTFATDFSSTFQGPTQIGQPAIFAWLNHGRGLNTPDPSVNIQLIEIPNDGTIAVAARVEALGPFGTAPYRYTYAIENLSSHQSISSIRIPVRSGNAVTAATFHAPSYHSGDPTSNAPWPPRRSRGYITWSCPQSFAENADASALRWGTLYTFSFQTHTPPEDSGPTSQLTTFRGTPISIPTSLKAPTQSCPADIDDGSGTGTPDGGISIDDLLYYLGLYDAGVIEADFDDGSLTGALDDGVEITDLLYYLIRFESGC